MLRGDMRASYDTIGVNYSDLRKPDSRIELAIGQALGSARAVLNVGAGAGSYEPAERHVTAIEPSAAMIRQRGASAAPGRDEMTRAQDPESHPSESLAPRRIWTMERPNP